MRAIKEDGIDARSPLRPLMDDGKSARKSKNGMNMENIEESLDLRNEELNVGRFAAALAVRHVHRLIANGGSENRHSDLDEVVQPHDLETFLARAATAARETGYFEHAWRQLQLVIPTLQSAWEQGRMCFQRNLVRAQEYPEEMEYLEQIDMAMDCFAYVSALKIYPSNKMLQNWLVNSYMHSWRQHFLSEDDGLEREKGDR